MANRIKEPSIKYPILPNLSMSTPKIGVISADVKKTTVMKEPAVFVSIPNI